VGFIFLSLVLTFTSMNAFAARSLFPGGCRSKGFSFDLRMLNLFPSSVGKEQSLYFIHNKTMSTINLSQMKGGGDAYTLFLNNKIKPNQWGVLAADGHLLKFACSVASRKSAHGKLVNCKRVLNVCEYTNVKFAPNNNGSYWGVKSKAKISARNDIIRQGVLLKW
jgi:hypothetical protein